MEIARFSEYGAYLKDSFGEEVLMPNRYVTEGMKEGDKVKVFVYHDSEDRLVAITDRPYAVSGEIASLKVVDKTIHGAFLDWGIPKDLFLPLGNQQYPVETGRKYVVAIYTDNVTDRVVATTKLNRLVSNNEISVREKEAVEILVASRNEFGFRVVVNKKHWGMLYQNQLFRPVEIGDELSGFVSKITEDNRIDIMLQQEGFDQVKTSAAKLLQLLEENKGILRLTDKSSPEAIYSQTQMSKKVFKKAVGYLFKNGSVLLTGDAIMLINEE